MNLAGKLFAGVVCAAIGVIVIVPLLPKPAATTVDAQPPAATDQTAQTTPQPDPASQPAPAQPAAPSIAVPPDEQNFVDIIAQYTTQYNQAANAMAQGAARHARKQAICAAFTSNHVSNWVGAIATLNSTGNGNGVLSIAINPNLTVSTANNEFSDSLEHTTIPAGSPLFNAVSAMKVGDTVYFSGDFQQSDDDCFEEDSLTTDGGMQQPDFDFKFSEVKEASSP